MPTMLRQRRGQYGNGNSVYQKVVRCVTGKNMNVRRKEEINGRK